MRLMARFTHTGYRNGAHRFVLIFEEGQTADSRQLWVEEAEADLDDFAKEFGRETIDIRRERFTQVDHHNKANELSSVAIDDPQIAAIFKLRHCC